MKYINILVLALLLCFSADFAFAADDHGLPWGDFSLRVLNFAVFLGLIWYFSGKGIKAFFKSHRDEAEQTLEEARQLKKDAIKELENAQARLLSIESECDKLIEEGRLQAEAIKAVIIEDAKKHAERLVLQAKQASEMEGMQERALLQAKMADEIVANLEKEITSRLNKDEHIKLIEKSLKKVVLA